RSTQPHHGFRRRLGRCWSPRGGRRHDPRWTTHRLLLLEPRARCARTLMLDRQRSAGFGSPAVVGGDRRLTYVLQRSHGAYRGGRADSIAQHFDMKRIRRVLPGSIEAVGQLSSVHREDRWTNPEWKHSVTA